MMPKTFADTRSPWYEAFAPWMKAPAAWRVASDEELPEPPTESAPADEEWTTEAIFDYYND